MFLRTHTEHTMQLLPHMPLYTVTAILRFSGNKIVHAKYLWKWLLSRKVCKYCFSRKCYKSRATVLYISCVFKKMCILEKKIEHITRHNLFTETGIISVFNPVMHQHKLTQVDQIYVGRWFDRCADRIKTQLKHSILLLSTYTHPIYTHFPSWSFDKYKPYYL